MKGGSKGIQLADAAEIAKFPLMTKVSGSFSLFMKKIQKVLLQRLASAYGTDAAAMRYFRGGHDWSDGVLYEYGHGDETRILKVMEFPATEAGDKLPALEARLKFVRYLGESGIPMIFPEPSADGGLHVREPDGERIYVAYSYAKREGTHIFQAPQDEREMFFVRWGEVMGRMHVAAREYPEWRRLPEDPEGTRLGWEAEWKFFHDWCKDEAVKESWRQLKTELDALPIERSGYGFTHNDLHFENLLIGKDGLTVLDFDVASPHWFACDLAIALYSIFTYAAGGRLEHPPADEKEPKRLFQSFLRGYETANKLDAFWFERIRLFLHYRRILLFIVFSDELERSHPEHRRVWRERILKNAPFPDYGKESSPLRS